METHSSRRLTAQFFSVVLATLLIPGTIVGEPQSSKLDTLAGELGDQVNIKASWSVLEGFIGAQLQKDKDQGLNGAALRRLKDREAFSDFDNPKKVSQYMYSLRKSMVAYSTTALVRTGVPLNIASEISERMPRQYLFQLEQALLSYTSIPGMKPEDLGNAVKGAVRQSTTALLVKRDMKASDFKPIANLIKANASAEMKMNEGHYRPVAYSQNQVASELELENRFLQSTQAPKLIDNKDLSKQMVDYLNDEAKKQFAGLNDIKQKEAFLDSLAEDFVARASATTVQAAAKQFSISEGVRVLTAVGQFQALERNTALQVSKGAEALHAGLEGARRALESTWKEQLVAAGQISGLDSLPASAAELANTSHLVNDLASFTSGGQLNRNAVMELAGVISSQIPGSKDIINLTGGIEQIASGQSSFVQQGQLLLGTLANITKSPVLGQVQSAFNSFAPVLQAAGPLLAMAGFASPLGGISMVGGLLGGGGGLMGGGGNDAQTQAMLQAISQKLEVMDHKLDQILEDLNALDRKITEEHVEVMNALESISFDINRTLELVSSEAVKRFTRDCEAIPGMVDSPQRLLPSQIEDKFRSCYANLGTVGLSSSSPEQIFRAIPHLKTENLSDTAFNKLQAIAKIYAKTGDSAERSCFSLVLAAYSVHDIDKIGSVGKAQAQKSAEKAMCTQVLSFGNMLHSGTITFFSSLEDQTADYSKKLTQASSRGLLWNDSSRKLLLYRWNQELLLLNIGIGQQARLTGDFTVPEWAEKLELTKPLDQTEQAVLDQSEILAQNSVHYWLETHLRATDKGPANPNLDSRQPVSFPLQYAFAYEACAPNYLRSLTESGPHGPTDFEKVHFNWTPHVLDQSSGVKTLQINAPAPTPSPCPTKAEENTRWCALFDGLKNCIALPTAEAMITGELRRSDNLEALLDARVKTLTLIESTNFIDSLDHDNRLRLVEVLAMKWAYDERQKEAEMATRVPQAVTASLVEGY